jgi:hypothetical protein
VYKERKIEKRKKEGKKDLSQKTLFILKDVNKGTKTTFFAVVGTGSTIPFPITISANTAKMATSIPSS